jgi:hypothetical protein
VMIPTSASSSNSQHIPTSEDNGKKEEVVVQKIKERRKSLMMFDQIQEPITASNDSEISNDVSSNSATSSASASSTNHQQLPSGGDDDEVVENVVGWARAAWAFSPADDSELEFNKGYLVAVTSWTNSDWWAGFAFKSYDDAQVTFSEPARVFPGVCVLSVIHSPLCFAFPQTPVSSLPFPNMCLSHL